MGPWKIKARLSGYLKRTRLAYRRAFRSFDGQSIGKMMQEVGIKPGDVLFVHSSYNAFEGFLGKPTEILRALEASVAPHGTILMPSLPFVGAAVDYLASGQVTDIRRTPSRMGLITELFRRERGTLRSLHPTHPVLAKGSQAAELVAGHEQATTPCGVGSPFSKLTANRGKIVLLGTSIEAMTFFHYLEEAYEDQLPRSPFASEPVTAEVIDGDHRVSVTMRLFDPDLSRRRRVARLVPELDRRRAIRRGRTGSLGVMVITASDAEEAFRAMVARGEPLYDA